MSAPARAGAGRRGSADLVGVAAVQCVSAALRFGFLVVLARVLIPVSFADVAVTLSWTQVIAAALGGGAGAYLLTSLPDLVSRGQDAAALARYRQTVVVAVVSSTVVALLVALVLWATGAAGATWVGLAVLATSGLRAALIATHESARGLGALALSQVLTMVVQPGISVAALALAAWTLGVPIDPALAVVALALSLAVPWVGQHVVTRRRIPAAPAGRPVSEPVEWRALLRLGAASAMLTWMVEGTLVLASFVIDDKVEVARYAAHVRLSVVTSIAAVTVSTVASTQWTRRTRQGGPPPSRGEAFRWSALGAGAAALAGVALLLVAGPVMRLFGEVYEFSPAVLSGLVVKDVAVAAATPIFYLLVMRGRPSAVVRASLAGAVALLAVPVGAAWGGLTGASLAAAAAGLVWLGAYVAEAMQVGRDGP